MNLFKKFTASLALVAILSGVFSTGVVAYSDAELAAANYLAEAGIVVDHVDDPAGYNLDQNVLRQEIAAVARGIADLPKKDTCDGIFADVSATTPNDWACYTVEQLADNGLIALNENFNPEQNITKSEAVGMMVKAAFNDEYMYDSTLSTTWQEQVVAFAVEKGVIANFTNYDTPATRGFVFEAGANAMEVIAEDPGSDVDNILCELFGICDEDTSGGENPGGEDLPGDDDPTNVITGDAEVSLNPKTPAAMTIPKAGLVPFGKFDFTAGREDVSISAITLKREGLSDRTDIRRLYFEKNGIRVSNRGNVGIDETALITFTPSLVVPAGSTLTLDLIVELSTNVKEAGGEHRFAIVSDTDVEASTTVGGVYPVRTNLMRIGTYEVKQVEVQEVFHETTYNVGQEDALLGEFRLITNGEKNNLFKSITLRNAGDGDASASLSNIALYKDNTKVSTEVEIVGRDLTIYVNDEITNGRVENYQLRANITGAERKNETYAFEIRNESDLNVVEIDSGFSAPVKLPTGTIAQGNVSFWGDITVEGGDFLVSRDTAYSQNQTVAPSTTDVVLWAAKINVAEEVSVEDVRVAFEAASANLVGNFSQLKLIVNEATMATITDTGMNDKRNLLFEANFTLRQGAGTMRITGNLANNASENSSFRIENVNIGAGEIRYVSNDEVVEVKGSAPGILTNVAAGELSITRNDGIDGGGSTIIPGATDKLVFGFQIRADDVSDIKLTGLSPKLVGTGISLSDMSNIRLYMDNKLISTKNNFDFNNLDATIKKNTTASFQVLADFTSSIPTTATFQLRLGTGDIVARNVDSNKQIDFGTTVVNSAPFSFAGEGTATVKVNSSQPNQTIITPSNTSETPVFKFDIEAENDNIRVTDVYVTNNFGGVAGAQNNVANLEKAKADLTAQLPTLLTASGNAATAVTTATADALTDLKAKVQNVKDTAPANVAAAKQSLLNLSTSNLRLTTTINGFDVTEATLGTALAVTTGSGEEAQVFLDAIVGSGTATATGTYMRNFVDSTTPGDSDIMYNATQAFTAAKVAYDDAVCMTNNTAVQTCANGAAGNYAFQIAAAGAGGSSIVDFQNALRDVHLYMSDGRTVKGTVISDTKLHFSFGTEGLIVKRDGRATGEVRIAFYDSNTRSSEPFQLTILSGAKASNETSGTVNGMRILSESSGREITRVGGNINGNEHVLARSKPTVAMASNFTASSSELYRFTVTADANRDLTLKELTLAIGNAGIGDGKITINRDSMSGPEVGTATIDTNTKATVIGNVVFSGTSVVAGFQTAGTFNEANATISAGTTVTFYVNMSSTANVPTLASREVRLTGLVYEDDVNAANIKLINAAPYNIGLPTTIASFRYDN